MELKGRVWKDEKSSWWLAEVSFLDVMTQGKTKKKALEMMEDAILELLVDSYGKQINKRFQLTIHNYEDDLVGVGASDGWLLFALGLKRQREKYGTTIRVAAKRLKSKSPNAYARYERGYVRPSIEKYNQLLHAANPYRRPLLVS
jgi:predicted RNase H-like HicB family nuclease